MARKVVITLSLDNNHDLNDFPIDIYTGLTSGDTSQIVFSGVTQSSIELEVEDADINVVNNEAPYFYVRLSSSGCHDEIIKVHSPRVDCTMCVVFEQYGSPTSTPNPTPTNTPTPTSTETPTPTPTATDEPTPTPTSTDEPTPTPTSTDEPTPTPTSTDEPEPTPTATDEPTPTPTPSPTDNIVVAGVRLTIPYTSVEDACDGSNKNQSNHAYILEGSSIFTLVNGYLLIDGSQLAMAGTVDYDLYYGDETISTNSLETSIGTVNGGSPSGWYLVDATSTTNIPLSSNVLATVNDTNNPTTITFSLCPTIQPTPTATSDDETGLVKIIDCDLVDENGQAQPGANYYLIDPQQTCIGGQLSLTSSLLSAGDIIYYRIGDETCSGSIMCAQVQSGTFTGTVTATRNGENVFTSCGSCYLP